MSDGPLQPGRVVTGPLFNEPMRVETVRSGGDSVWVVGLVGLHSERFRNVTLTGKELDSLRIRDAACSYDGDGKLLRLGIQAYSLGISYEFDPYFGLSISRVDPLPHQLEAVYDYLLKLARVRFLLADDAGAGKTIMAGLLIRELKLRGLAERILICCPANLAFQWQRELNEKFDEKKFVVIQGANIRDQFGINQWLEQNHVITSLDLAKRADILPGLKQVHWDLAIVDEAHRMSWTPPARKTARYALGELIRDTTDHLLMLTATPHKGDPANFTLFMQLLDQDAYADIKSIREAMNRRRAPFYLRRTKEAMVYFPERQPDGTWAAKKIFTKRIPHTAAFEIDGDEFQLYRDVTRFVKTQSAKAAAQGDDPRACAVGFLMSLYQRRLASSTYALRHSLENRTKRLEDSLKKAQQLAHLAPPEIPDPDELEEMEEGEREKLEELIEAMTLAQNAEQIREEIEELRRLAAQAGSVEDAGHEAKLKMLEGLLHVQGFFDHPEKRLLLFTEFKDTLDYLVNKLTKWGFRVGFIHGGMAPGSRGDKGTRIYTEQQFKDGEIQVLVATEAAGEGINLQCCSLMVNYDIPWNPNRLEQRMGRIHRYKQEREVMIFNLVAKNTREGEVMHCILRKLEDMRTALGSDRVYDVIGEIIPVPKFDALMKDWLAKRRTMAEILADIDLQTDETQVARIRADMDDRSLGSRYIDLSKLDADRQKSKEQRLMPEYIEKFFVEAYRSFGGTIAPVKDAKGVWSISRVPPDLRKLPDTLERRFGKIGQSYPKITFDKEQSQGYSEVEFIGPGHPLFESVVERVLRDYSGSLRQGAVFYNAEATAATVLWLLKCGVEDGRGQTIGERLVAVHSTDNRFRKSQPYALLDLKAPDRAADVPAAVRQTATSEDVVIDWSLDEVTPEYFAEINERRSREPGIKEKYVRKSLQYLIGESVKKIAKYDSQLRPLRYESDPKRLSLQGNRAQEEARKADLSRSPSPTFPSPSATTAAN